MKALIFERDETRYAAANVASRFRPGTGATVGPLRLAEVDPPELPGDDWVRVRPRLSGICGSDLATVEGRSSRYFDPLVSFPFVPGHEVVGVDPDGRRVAIEPVLGPASRGERPPFEGAAPGDADDYGYLLGGPIDDGIQIGFCASTGGGWSTEFVAHQSQVHPVPDSLSDESAVMLEPVAGGVHAALKARAEPGDLAVILGTGTMGLCALAALRAFAPDTTIIATSKHAHQRRFAEKFGADLVVSPSEARRAVRRATGCRMLGDDLAGGADVVIDAVGSSASIAEAIAVCRPRGRAVLLGMPGHVELDLTPLWHRETELVGAYTYGTEHLADGTTSTSFALALGLAEQVDFGEMVSATYPLSRHADALAHAANAGQRGAIKVAFDFRA